ncbi:MAG: hypothetical protein HC913_11295 [Microscillaceae bacterium]|nr:hypothetical protein [Microscillaceae bacterium]
MRAFQNAYYRKWFWFAPLGFSLFGFGLCLAIEVAIWKNTGLPFWQWFGLGTGALILANSGLAFIGDAVKNRVFYEWQKKNSTME